MKIKGNVFKKVTKDNSKVQVWKEKPKKKKRIIAFVLTFMILLGAGGGTYYYYTQVKTIAQAVTYQSVKVSKGDLSLDLSESGTTSYNTQNQTLDFDSSVVEMTVEDVYVASGDTVKAGDKLLKITDDSYQKAVEYYKEQIEDATKTLANAKSSLATGKSEASYDKQKTTTDASNAQSTYDTQVAQLEEAVSLAQAQYDGTQQEISAYQAAIDNNTYYSENDIDTKTKALADAKTQAATAQTSYDTLKSNYNAAVTSLANSISALSATSSSISTDITSLQSSYQTVADLKTQLETAQKTLEDANQAQTKAQDALDTATNSYDKEVADAKSQIETLTNKLPDLQTSLTAAQNADVTGKASLKNDYDSSVTKGTYAQSTYDSTINTLQDALDTAQTTLDNLKVEQTALHACADGVVSASKDGTIAKVNYQKGDTLSTSKACVAYYDQSKVTVSVEVPQADISKIAVNDSVSVQISGKRNGNLTGTIDSISSSATSGSSKSNVTYSVVIALDNSDGSLTSGSTTYVTFSFGNLSDVLYLPIDAISGKDGTSANVKQYDKTGKIVNNTVTIGDETDKYVVITKGLSEGDTCLVEVGGEK